jgi:phosphoserine/homoserine phosphotransferase
MQLICSDLEGVFTPEIWINVATKTGIEALRRTTRDEPDYDKLMQYRLQILADNNLTLQDIQAVIEQIDPEPGAKEFLDWLRSKVQVCILSDTFSEFAAPLMAKLGYPLLLCHNLEVDTEGKIVNYHLRMPNQKQAAVKAFQSLNYQVIAMGDSYNDINMLKQAASGILFRPPANVIEEYPQFPVITDYVQLKDHYLKLLNSSE